MVMENGKPKFHGLTMRDGVTLLVILLSFLAAFIANRTHVNDELGYVAGGGLRLERSSKIHLKDGSGKWKFIRLEPSNKSSISASKSPWQTKSWTGYWSNFGR